MRRSTHTPVMPGPKSTLPWRCVAAVACIATISPVVRAAAGPDVPAFESAIADRLQKLRPSGIAERNVRFLNVQAGPEKNGAHAFRATILIRDYGPGYPANHFYGETCVGRLVDQVYWMSPDGFGGWRVEGAMTPDLANRQCTRNPVAGVSSVPAESLQGTAAPVASTPSSAMQAAPSRPEARTAAARGNGGSAAIATGEWACYGAGGRALIGLAFRVNGDGTYTDLDGKSRGTYALDAAAGTLSFRGGHLDGQVGHAMGGGRFNIGTTTCEPHR